MNTIHDGEQVQGEFIASVPGNLNKIIIVNQSIFFFFGAERMVLTVSMFSLINNMRASNTLCFVSIHGTVSCHTHDYVCNGNIEKFLGI